MPGYKWPDLVIAIAVAVQVIITLSLIIYFLAIHGACTHSSCEPANFIQLPYFKEDQFVAKFRTNRSLFMFYNVFVVSAYMYLAITVLVVVALLFRFREFMAFPKFRAKAVLVAVVAAYLAVSISTLLFPNSYIETSQLQGGIQHGDTSGYLIFFCLGPFFGLFLATIFSWKKYDIT